MSKPIAYFGYSVDNQTLKVSFQNLSLQSPNSYSWDFGVPNATSTEESPNHTYTSPGIYSVKLVAANDDGDSIFIKEILVGEDFSSRGGNILELVLNTLPIGVEFTTEQIAKSINYFQEYIQPLIYIPFKVTPEDKFNEARYPLLVNFLIADLVSYNLIEIGAARLLNYMDNLVVGAESSDGQVDIEADGRIKSIETGPTKVEYWDSSKELDKAEIIKRVGSAYGNITKEGGLLDLLQKGICQKSKRLRIYLPMCGQLSKNTIVPDVEKIKEQLIKIVY